MRSFQNKYQLTKSYSFKLKIGEKVNKIFAMFFGVKMVREQLTCVYDLRRFSLNYFVGFTLTSLFGSCFGQFLPILQGFFYIQLFFVKVSCVILVNCNLLIC
eukprot:TRINITY_DN10292_c1_g1_i1.p5 TRINITY_DN10292_c1_g1~~TRINITY_DN10292_c1_g1_i1.p5  ORF type:complete len:102 (-),score=0.59 TRINITY_DN10292_c1_g1_i1:196-501(-)